MNEDDGLTEQDEPSGRWQPITGPLRPIRAAVLSVAFEKAGIAVAFIRPDEHDVFPTEFGAHLPGHLQLVVLEDQVERARAVMAQVDGAFALNSTPSASAPVEIEEASPRPAARPRKRPRAPKESPQDKAFEAKRIKRYTEGLFVFVVGLVWTLSVLPRGNSGTALSLVGVLILCTGLFMIYAALSMRKQDENEAAGGQIKSGGGDVDG